MTQHRSSLIEQKQRRRALLPYVPFSLPTNVRVNFAAPNLKELAFRPPNADKES